MMTQHPIFDTHAHYHDSRFSAADTDLPDIHTLLDTLFSTEICNIIEVSTDIAHAKAAIALAEQYPAMYAAVGMYPGSCPLPYNAEETERIIAEFSEMLDHEKVVALGEIGYDFHYDNVPRDVQKLWFDRQMRLAAEKNIPVVIHDREAHGAVMEMVAAHPDVRGVLHSYSGSAEMARQLIARGWMISLSGVVTFKNARQTVEVAEQIPLSSLLVETDCPYLTPHPHRGKINHSGYLVHTVQRIAEIRGISAEEVRDATKNNAKRFFGI